MNANPKTELNRCIFAQKRNRGLRGTVVILELDNFLKIVQEQRFENLQDRAMCIINGNRKSEVKLSRINHFRNGQCAVEVFKCLKGLAPEVFEIISRGTIRK